MIVGNESTATMIVKVKPPVPPKPLWATQPQRNCSPTKSSGTDNDILEGGGGHDDDDSLIKQRISELFESHIECKLADNSYSSPVCQCSVDDEQSRTLQPNSRPVDSQFDLPFTDSPVELLSSQITSAETVNAETLENSVTVIEDMVTSNGSHPSCHHHLPGEMLSPSFQKEPCSSSEDEDVESEASSPRNLSTYSDNVSTTDGGELECAGLLLLGHPRAYHIVRELVTSERVFVDVLKLLTNDFPAALKKAEESLRHPTIPQEVLNQILDCLPQLRSLNEDLLRDLESRLEKWNEIGRISDVIVCKGPFLKLYTMYIKKFPTLTAHLDEALRRYPQFAQVVRDFEMSDRCRKLELKHYMLKPVQRIPQYRMLLHDYLRQIAPDSPDFEDTRAALSIVSEVASHANDSMKDGDKFAKLMQIQSRIAGSHEIIKPGRTFIKEGELLKLCRKEMQPRWFVLFSDVLLHLSSTSQGLLRIHHELPLSSMKVSVPTQEDYKNEFSVISVKRSFTLAACSPLERDQWLSELNSAIRQTVTRHATFMQAKLQQLNISDNGNNTEMLGHQAPVWIPDSRVTMCQLCLHEFTLTFRRHHCRACGKVVCSVCSANRAPLSYLNYATARVCYECFSLLQKEIDERVSACNGDLPVVGNINSNGFATEHSLTEIKRHQPSLKDLKAQFKKYYRNSSDQKHRRHLPKVLKEVCANDAGSSISGYLYRRVKKTWKRQWFVIKDKVLYTYRASEDVAALDSTPLLGFQITGFSEPRDGIHHQLGFELRHPGHPLIEFYAESLKSAERWFEAFREATVLE